ncbi:DNA/RNA nuclease SfsA [Ruminococcus sp. XPD3002]|uniref:DNA/RNA nuclease SfsA n=1 Tax=Ruminococcus sp. XPD3002 TaxID=1452269 RepID=UPI0009100418|nr:sugar fermentation stimulation protein A [Ruminococcus flavefaciens]
MRYRKVIPGRFISRPDRFTAIVLVGGSEEMVHVKNTGRCRELLLPDASVYLAEADNPDRRTRYDLIAVEKVLDDGSKILINMDSQAPNKAAGEWLRSGGLFGEGASVRSEVRYRDSRFDFYIEQGERRIFLEVKGVTLEREGVAMFPDAPTERGLKHVRELAECINEGYEAYVLFVIQMKGMHLFRPNNATHPQFGEALAEAQRRGVNIAAYDCIVEPDSMTIDSSVDVLLD